MPVSGHDEGLCPAAPGGSLSREAREVLVVVNPSAGARRKGRAVDELVRALEGHDLEVRRVAGREQLETELRRASLPTLRCIVAAGGDGTVAEVVNRAPGIPVAVLPLGTENLLARYVGAPRDPESLAVAILQGRVRRFDLPLANGRFFTLMAGIGFDAEVVHRVAHARHGNLVRADYGKPILQALRTYTYPELVAWTDANPTPLRGRLAFVFNLPCYGLGLPLAPEARGDDGLLDLVLFEKGSTRKLLGYLWAVLRRKHTRLPDVHAVRAKRVRFESERPAPVQLDGDPFGWTPLEIAIDRQSLAVVVPEAQATGKPA
jgi:YegS/Rv2252/BmrU family lipid kinase